MGKHPVIAVLVLIGMGLAVLVGLAGARGGDSSASAQENLCSSLSSLESSTQALVDLDPSTASKDDYQSDVSTVQNDWNQVTSDASTVASDTMNTLDGAWDSFEQTVKDVPDDASASDAIAAVQESGQALVSTTKSTLAGLSCS
jgi:hypothetical protein